MCNLNSWRQSGDHVLLTVRWSYIQRINSWSQLDFCWIGQGNHSVRFLYRVRRSSSGNKTLSNNIADEILPTTHGRSPYARCWCSLQLIYLDCILLIFLYIILLAGQFTRQIQQTGHRVTGLHGPSKRPYRVNWDEAGMLKCQFAPASFRAFHRHSVSI